MTYEEDLDLEARLRRISADPQPEVPARTLDYVVEVAGGEHQAGGSARAAVRNLGTSGIGTARPRRLAALVGIAAAVVLAASGLMVFATLRGPSPAATARYSDLWSALEWHDITASGFPGPYMVVTFKGELYGNVMFAGARSGLWTSLDGSAWTQIPGAPTLNPLVSAGTWLFGVGIDDHALWYTSDGTTWKTATIDFTPNEDQSQIGVLDGHAIMLTDTVGPSGDSFTSPSVMYRSADGANWQKVALPADMAAALQSTIGYSGAGYLVTGFVVDPTGQGELSGVTNSSTYDLKGFYRTWSSPDGINWSTESTASDRGIGTDMAYSGALGYSRPEGNPSTHSTDGVHWTNDADDLSPYLRGQVTFTSNGHQVVVQSNGPIFYVGIGDGRWQRLLNVGDAVGGLPTPGQSWAVPGGVLYTAGSQVFFGKALTGTVDAPTLAPGITITDPPVATMKPRPSASLPPVAAWTGLGDLQALPKGPVAADYVVSWAYGYVAVRNPATSDGQITVWLSTDGKSWDLIPPSAYGTATSAIPVAAGGSLILDQTGGGNNLRMTTDGKTWQDVWGGRPPLGTRMVGDARGAVFAMQDPENQITFNANGIDPDATWRMASIPNGTVDTVQDVALSGSGFIAVGRAKDSSGKWEPASWTSSDGVTWAASTSADSPGDGFTRVFGARNGYLAMSRPVSGGTAAATLWSSSDGKSWQHLTSGPLGSDAIYAADGSHIIGCQVDGGGVACWSSLNGSDWATLAVPGDSSQLAAAGTSLRIFPLLDGVLFVTPDAVWRAAATK